jgi:DHA2 family multidrug resistance protein
VAEIVVIPLTGFLTPVFSLRRYLLANTIMFLVMSVSCAFAQDLSQMIVLRALQGFFGGVLIPLSFTITLTMLPRSKQPIGLAMFAVSATFAPAIGPTIGGYLTETYGWQYIFYVNLVPGAIMLATLWPSLKPAPMKLWMLRQGDWLGIATLAIGLASLQTVLEEGNKDDWFGSPFIVRLAVVAAVSLALFFWIEFTTPRPQTQGYNSEQVGMVLAWTGLPQLVLIPCVPFLMKHIDARFLVAVGFGLFAASCFMNLAISPDYAGDQLFAPNLVRAVGQALVLTPLSALATGGIERENAGSASAMFNMMRNLGGSMGIAVLETFVTKREQFHSNVISAQVSLLDSATRDRITSLQSYFMANGMSDPATAWHEAVVQIGRTVRAQSYLLAYSDAFYLMGAALVLAFATALAMRKSSGGGAGAH